MLQIQVFVIFQENNYVFIQYDILVPDGTIFWDQVTNGTNLGLNYYIKQLIFF